MDRTRQPSVSVIVPVHDVAAHVAEAIASLRAQTLTDFEAIVIDDGSTDDSLARARAAIQGDPRFQVVQQPNRGLSAARNAGIDRARGTFLAFLDGDDAFAPDFLQTLTDACQHHGTDWAASALTLVTPAGQVDHPGWHGPGAPGAGVIDLTDACRAQPLFPSAWNKVWRREVFGDLRFPEGLWFEDHEVYWRMAARAPRLALVPRPLVRHRRERPGQITGRDDDRAFDILTVLDRLHPLVTQGGFAQGARAFDRLATRLLHERAAVLRQPDRRRRFVAAARAAMARWPAAWDAGDDPDIARAFGLELAGQVPLTLLVPPGAPPPDVPGAEVLPLNPGADLARIARLARGRHILILGPGESLCPAGADRLVNRVEMTGAPAAAGALLRPGGAWHDGWCDNRGLRPDRDGITPVNPALALRRYPALGALLVSRPVLEGLTDAPPWVPDALGVQTLALRLVLRAGRVALLDHPVVAQSALAPLPEGLARHLHAQHIAPMPRGWRGVLALRLTGLAGWRPLRRLVLALRLGLLAPPVAARPDPDTPLGLRLAVLAPFRAVVAPGAAAGDNPGQQG